MGVQYNIVAQRCDTKQLLDEVEHVIMNYQSLWLWQITQTRGFDNS